MMARLYTHKLAFPFMAILVFCLSNLSAIELGHAATVSNYILGSGDRIRIQVYGEDDLTKEELLTDTGTISYPFIGAVHAKGLTVEQLRDTITKGLDDKYIINPRVSISIIEYRQFYINGEVSKPGGYPYQPGMTVRKAISLAQGFTDRASKTSISVISDSDATGKPSKTTLDATIHPGDIITVEQSFF